MIQKVHIKNFKTLKDLRFTCTRMNLFIGDTSTGKTNILEALTFFSRNTLTQNQFDRRLIRYEKPVDFFPMHDLSEPVEVVIDGRKFGMIFNHGRFQLELSGPKAPGAKTGLIAQGAMDAHGRMNDPATFQFTTPIRRYEYRPDVPFGPNGSKELDPPYGANLPGLLASNKQLRTNINSLLEPTGMRLKVNLTDNAIRVVRTIDVDVEEELPYSNVSDTIKRYLFLYTILNTNTGCTLLLDEPEQNSFPFYVKHTGEMLGLDKENQYFITTHNEYLFRAIVEKTPKKELSVFITFNNEAGHTRLKRLSSTELAKLLDMDVFFNLDRFVKA